MPAQINFAVYKINLHHLRRKEVFVVIAVNTYEEIEYNQRQNEDKQIIILLFVRPTAPDADKIIKEFDYIHFNSAKYCSIYAVGYSNDPSKANDNGYSEVAYVAGNPWYFSTAEFVKFKNNLENRIHWCYSGEVEAIILQSNPGGQKILNFQNYVAIDVNRGIREGYIDSFSRFMESLIRSSKKEVTAKEAISRTQRARYSIKNIVEETIDGCKQIPTPVKKIMKDRLFYAVSSKCQSNE